MHGTDIMYGRRSSRSARERQHHEVFRRNGGRYGAMQSLGHVRYCHAMDLHICYTVFGADIR
eukprot:2058427-Rhodomonas_salina.1